MTRSSLLICSFQLSKALLSYLAVNVDGLAFQKINQRKAVVSLAQMRKIINFYGI